MKPLKALLVGLGQIGCGYDIDVPFVPDKPQSGPFTYTHARALMCHPDVDFLGAIDPSTVARNTFSSVYNLPAFDDISGFLQHFNDAIVDLIVFAVPPSLQPSMVGRYLSILNPRILLLEKPLAVCNEDARFLYDMCSKKKNLLVAVNYIRRFLPSVLDCKSLLIQGQLGEFLHGSLVYGKGLLSNASHFVNLAEYWLGPLQLKSVLDIGPHAFGFDRESSIILNSECYAKSSIYVHSIGTSGLRAGELDLWFSNGRLLWSNDGGSIHIWGLDASPSSDTYCSLSARARVIASGLEHYQHLVLDNVLRHYSNPTHVPLQCDLDSGLTTLKLLNSVFHAYD